MLPVASSRRRRCRAPSRGRGAQGLGGDEAGRAEPAVGEGGVGLQLAVDPADRLQELLLVAVDQEGPQGRVGDDVDADEHAAREDDEDEQEAGAQRHGYSSCGSRRT